MDMSQYHAYLADKPYVLTGEEKPYFVGRWFESLVQDAPHMITLTDGAYACFLVDNADYVRFQTTPLTKMTSCIAYTLDNSDPVRQSVDDTVIPLPDKGCHILTIIADGMPEWEGKWTHERGLALFEIAPAQGGVLLGVKPTGKTIFFYGDSITEGSHALGDVACNGNSATCAYPWFCAKALGCTPYYVGYGGSGVLREGSLNTFYMTIDWLAYERPLAYEPVPHVIVVNHGTNDGETRDVDFETTLRHSLTHLRERYPNVPFVYMIPFMQTKAHIIREVVAKFDNAYVVETSHLAMTYSDGVHPDPKGAKLAGEMLAVALQNIFGKAFFSQKE